MFVNTHITHHTHSLSLDNSLCIYCGCLRNINSILRINSLHLSLTLHTYVPNLYDLQHVYYTHHIADIFPAKINFSRHSRFAIAINCDT